LAELSFDLEMARAGTGYAMAGKIPLEGVTAIMGPSGSGKTTLLMMLAGLEPRARGTVRFAEKSWAEGRRGLPPEARRVGMVFQEGRLFGHLNVADNIAYGARRRGTTPAAIQGITDALGLEDLLHRHPVTLSGGEARRVAVARALASAPDILFMDEPVSGLDDMSKAQVLPYLARAVTGSGIPVLYVTHSTSEVTQLADRVLRVADGRIAGWGVPPARLSVTVTGMHSGHVILDLGGVPLVLPGQGRAGDARTIALPAGGVLLSRDAPGSSGALAVLRASVVSVAPRPGGPDILLETAGQRLTQRLDPASPLAAQLPAPGAQLYLSILAAHLR
jgi:molybdate transport system ATP-binding protein